jgi:protein-S-isoprenylcysteine O-methyltransferase Ste14
MKATRWEYRLRMLVHGVLFALGFGAPWMYLTERYWPQLAEAVKWEHKSTWLVLSSQLARHGWLSFSAAVNALLIVALVFTLLGAWFRVWGSAYIGASVMKSRSMHGEAMLADGPYRRTRNPLYLGTLLHTVGLAILMPPSGAIFAIVTIWIFQIRLALAEEPFLAAQFGQPYLDYAKAVPRFLPSLTPLVPAAGVAPRWLQAVAGELYFVGAFLVMAVFGWGFNAMPIERGILISLGAWFVALALFPKAAAAA